MIGIIRRLLEKRRERKRKEKEEAFRYMVRTLIETNSPTVIIENGGKR